MTDQAPGFELTALEAATIVDALEVLAELERRATYDHLASTVPSVTARDLGRFAGAANAAEHALFMVLNVASSYLHSPMASQALEHHYARISQRSAA